MLLLFFFTCFNVRICIFFLHRFWNVEICFCRVGGIPWSYSSEQIMTYSNCRFLHLLLVDFNNALILMQSAKKLFEGFFADGANTTALAHIQVRKCPLLYVHALFIYVLNLFYEIQARDGNTCMHGTDWLRGWDREAVWFRWILQIVPHQFQKKMALNNCGLGPPFVETLVG